MEFKCTTKTCSQRGKSIVIRRIISKYVDGSLITNAICSTCNKPLEDVTKFEGFGHVKRSTYNASKNHFKRYKG